MQVSNITVSHDGKINHVDNVSTIIPRGKITTIIGPNGCGKSTLLGTLSRENKPQQGQVYLEEQDIVQYKPKEFAKKLAIVYQQNQTPKDITIEKLVSFGRLPYQSMFTNTQDADNEAINWALESTNLLEKRYTDLEALSGGERQRVWIAMALAQKAEILCLDEPTTYLDIYYQLELLALIQKLNQTYGLTIVMVLHDINQAIRYSDHLIMMKQGKIVAEGAPSLLTAKNIKEVYDVNVAFKHDELGAYIVPLGV